MLSDIIHLSGGQKSVVALAFVFALQKCDPAPFFILDEVDAALDSRHRRRVVQFMRKQTDRQFVCTTFRREFLADADRFVAVSYGQKESRLRQVGREEAEQFINKQEEESQVRKDKKAAKRKRGVVDREEQEEEAEDDSGQGDEGDEEEEPMEQD